MSNVSVMLPVKIEHAWQYHMTVCSIKTLRDTTKVPFQLVIAQVPSSEWDVWQDVNDGDICIDTKSGSSNGDCNLGFDQCDGDFIVYTGNDVMVRNGWLEALLEVFEKKPDAGVATLASADLKGKLPFSMPSTRIEEGVYGPFMMFRKGWKVDVETFPGQFGDSDLVMRIYQEGFRSYRNYRVVIEHLNRQTLTAPENPQDDTELLEARERFIAKHNGCGLLMYRMLSQGWVV